MTKNIFKALVLALSLTTFSLAQAEDKLNYGVDRGGAADVNDYKGKTFLTFMQESVKPQLDAYATDGYAIANGDVIAQALDNVSDKVSKSALRAAGSEKRLKDLADKLSASGEKYTLYTLPDAIADADPTLKRGRFDLSTFLALASGGGVAVKFTDDDYAYNVNYGDGTVKKDGQTGRSFGATAKRGANDASDSAYLKSLQAYAQSGDKNVTSFFGTIIEVLTNCDTSRFDSIADDGRGVLADFLAVYIAEQDRNLMDGDLTTQQWDASLLEATLLSYFHAGQSKMWVMFMIPPTQDEIKAMQKAQEKKCTDAGKPKDCTDYVVGFEGKDLAFTDTTLAQAAGGIARTEQQKASMVDYWQYSFVVNAQQHNRSGINITRPAFRALGRAITDYERKNNPDLVNAIEKFFPKEDRGDNVYMELSNFLLSYDTPQKLGDDGQALAKAYEAFLDQVYQDADVITAAIQKDKKFAKSKYDVLN